MDSIRSTGSSGWRGRIEELDGMEAKDGKLLMYHIASFTHWYNRRTKNGATQKPTERGEFYKSTKACTTDKGPPRCTCGKYEIIWE